MEKTRSEWSREVSHVEEIPSPRFVPKPRFAYECRACFAVWFQDAPLADCPNCKAAGQSGDLVKGVYNDSICNKTCTHAEGGECHCSCGGANHGSFFEGGKFTFRPSTKERREYRAKQKADASTDDAIRARIRHNSMLEHLIETLEEDREDADAKALAIADSIIATQPAPAKTKGNKVAKTQVADFIVESVKIKEQYAYNQPSWSNAGPQEYLSVVMRNGAGDRFWCKLQHGEGMSAVRVEASRYEKATWDTFSNIYVGDVIRVASRVKDVSDDGAITFLAAAHVKVICHPDEIVESGAKPYVAPQSLTAFDPEVGF